MKTLSIFCDESGDFGSFAEHSPYYIVSFVLHDQSNEIKEQIKHLENSIQYYGLSSKHAIHSAPLIRREGAYASLDAVSRKKIWDKLFTFFLKCPVLYFSILVEKREAGGGDDLADAIARQLTSVLRSKNDYISNFDKVNIYYDKGQKEITRILRVA